jgi:hypothetical protein
MLPEARVAAKNDALDDEVWGALAEAFKAARMSLAVR